MTQPLPVNFENWLSKLVFEDKREYARDYGTAMILGTDLPERPTDANWVPKCERRVERLLNPFL